MMKFAGGLEEQSPRSRRRADGSGEAASFAVVINTSMDYARLDRLSHSRSRKLHFVAGSCEPRIAFVLSNDLPTRTRHSGIR